LGIVWEEEDGAVKGVEEEDDEVRGVEEEVTEIGDETLVEFKCSIVFLARLATD